MNEYQKFDIKRVSNIIYVLLVLILLVLVFRLSLFMLPFVIAIIVVFVTRPLTRFFVNKLKLKYNIANTISILLFYLLIVLILLLIATRVGVELINLVANIDVYNEAIRNYINNTNNMIEEYIKFIPEVFTNEITNYINQAISLMIQGARGIANKGVNIVISFPVLLLNVIITVASTFIISADIQSLKVFIKKQVPKTWVDKLKSIKGDVFNMILVYFKAQLILITLSFFELIIGLNIISSTVQGIPYTLTIAIIIGIIDALPILGSGLILTPWYIISLLNANFKLALALFILHMVLIVVRQSLEPRLISKEVATHPLITLMAMYAGFKLFGVIGFLVGPIIMLILKNVFSRELEIGFFKLMIGEEQGNDEKETENNK